MRSVVIVIAVLSATTSIWPVAVRAQAAASTPDHVARDVAVFAALLNHPSIRKTSERPGLVVVQDIAPQSSLRIDGPQAEERLRRFLRKPEPKTLDEFLRVVRQEGELPTELRQVPGVVLVGRAELERRLEAPGRDYWQLFARYFPKSSGIVSLSRIAYNESGNEAMAYLAFSCGLLCGHGLAVVLQQFDGRWTVVEHMYLWES